MHWLAAATGVTAALLLLWTGEDATPAASADATPTKSDNARPRAFDGRVATGPASPRAVAEQGTPTQLERTLDSEARLEEQGDAARRKLIERTLPRLVRQVEQAELAGDVERAALLRKRVAHFRSARDDDR